VIVAGCRDAVAARQLGFIPTGSLGTALELVREYEPLIRREVRLHLEDQRLARLFDSMDICQSVLASFFLRTAVRSC